MYVLQNGDTVNTCKYLGRNREGKYHLEDLSAGWKMILKRNRIQEGFVDSNNIPES